MRSIFTVIVAAAVALSLAAPAGAEVDIPTSGRLVYPTMTTTTREDGGGSARPDGIGTMALDATDRQVLRSDSEYTYRYPSWSPDGQWILYQQDRNAEPYTDEVAVMRRDGTQQRILATDAIQPAWSPDGARLVWAHDRLGSEGHGLTVALVVDAAFDVLLGASTTVDTPRQASKPRFSPDGTTIAFSMSAGWPGPDTLWSVGADGTGLRELARDVDLSFGDHQWSPDGRKIAFSGRPLDSDIERLYLADPDGSNRRVIVRSTSSCFIESFAWAPSGDYLVFGGRSHAGFSCFDAISPDGTRHHRFDTDDFNWHEGLSFSPDGSIVYSVATRPDGDLWPDLYAFAADGSGRKRLTFDQTVSFEGVQAIDPGAVLRGYGTTAGATAAAVSRRFHKRAGSVVIAPAGSPNHALVAAPLAAKRGAPVLLTGRRLSAPMRREIRRLRAGAAVLVGPVTAGVQTQLERAGLSVSRLGGSSPAATAGKVARQLNRRRAFLVPNHDRWWAQATAGSNAASLEGVAVLPTGRKRLPTATRRAIARNDIDRILVIGDGRLISNGVVRRLERRGVSVARIDVRNRFALSARLATRAQRRGTAIKRPVATSGDTRKHSITVGAAAARRGRVTLMAPRRTLGDAPATQRWISRRRSKINKVDLVGGPRVIRPRVETQLERRVGR